MTAAGVTRTRAASSSQRSRLQTTGSGSGSESAGLSDKGEVTQRATRLLTSFQCSHPVGSEPDFRFVGTARPHLSGRTSRARARQPSCSGSAFPACRATRVPELHRQDARRDRKTRSVDGRGSGRLKHGRDGDDRDAAGVGCYRNSSSAGPRWVGMLVPAPVPERAFDAPIGTWATGKTHPLIVAVVPGSLNAIANASWVDSSARSKSPTLPTRLASTRRHRSRKTRSINQRLPWRGDAPTDGPPPPRRA